MTKSTEWLVRVVCVVGILWFGWQVTAQTVVALIQQGQQIQALTQQLKSQSTVPGVGGKKE